VWRKLFCRRVLFRADLNADTSTDYTSSDDAYVFTDDGATHVCANYAVPIVCPDYVCPDCSSDYVGSDNVDSDAAVVCSNYSVSDVFCYNGVSLVFSDDSSSNVSAD
jgi:hypothetical protein